ncbi:ThuA domain-containing protein [Litchfieldia alkalitelluris]|uniref:ThuA domain-containing protein n=1 Tax=Litchfieldia alkalitelluris TaxID=304268 RepID=UPI0009962C10|nr:ThuA domain-containing protein [Litchfieldia alkalitelluris]
MTKRIVAVLGDFYHSEELAKKSLETVLQGIEETKVEYLSRSQLVANLETKPDVVVLFAENRINPEDEMVNQWMDDEAAKAISNYVSGGGKWLAWHSGLASYHTIEEYTKMLRGYFEYHPAEHQVVTYFSDQADSFEFIDEHYFVKCDEANTNVFLRSESVDGTSIAGWEHSYGSGHVMCFVPAHREEGLLHPRVIKLLEKSLK